MLNTPSSAHYSANCQKFCIYLVVQLQTPTLQCIMPSKVVNTVDHKVGQLKIGELSNLCSSVDSLKFLVKEGVCGIMVSSYLQVFLSNSQIRRPSSLAL